MRTDLSIFSWNLSFGIEPFFIIWAPLKTQTATQDLIPILIKSKQNGEEECLILRIPEQSGHHSAGKAASVPVKAATIPVKTDSTH